MSSISRGWRFENTKDFFRLITDYNRRMKLATKYAEQGVEALREATPKDSGLTADSWEYSIKVSSNGSFRINWYNTNIQDGVPIAVIIQHGRGTKDGAWIEGVDYINPAMKPVFIGLAEEAWKEVQ